ncbi:MAG TPA: hypothetical protein VKZ66_04595 [Pusillimonas sp.]|uniref:hypothetical protein n=1 Tax=unclassified Pusillimonas TaxID=2640016 RepID=UPI00261B5F49|nr:MULTISPECIES: hypothetical protein [unclassified Pusillimonas]HLU19218.1 hypothetical protein [Pusillimonas sp.]
MEMTPLYSPKSESEASVLTAMMQAYDIDFLMQGAAFSTMYPGPVTSSLNAQVLMVRSDQFELARELLASFLQSSDGPDDKSTEHK